MQVGVRISPKRLRSQAPLFGRDTHVLVYWLSRAEGFEVATRNRTRGRVEQVIADPSSRRAAALVVRPSSRIPRRRRLLIAADAVVAVDPLARRIYLTHARERARPLVVPSHTRALVRRGLVKTPSTASSTVIAVRAIGAWLRPRLHRSGETAVRILWTLSARLVAPDAWLRPRVRAWERSVRADMRRIASRSADIVRHHQEP